MIADNDVSRAREGGTPTDAPRPAASGRIQGLDSLRIILAVWVVIAHFGVPYTPSSEVARGVLGNAFNGLAAVIAFFIISGFCIHLPYSRGRTLSLPGYFLRREVRILTPLVVLFALGAALHNFAFTVVMWSLVCEEVYYAVYPAILKFRRRYGWRPIFAVFGVAALAIAVFAPRGWTPPENGYGFTPLYLLPAWLLGCVLAEHVEAIGTWQRGRLAIWPIRLAVWGASFAMAILRWHSSVPESYFLLPFALLVYYWLRCEIAFCRKYPPKPWLETLGQGSYTVYLTHQLVPGLVVLLGIAAASSVPKTVFETTRVAYRTPLDWIALIGVTSVFCAIFYLLIERSSHRLAKEAGRRLENRSLKRASREAGSPR